MGIRSDEMRVGDGLLLVDVQNDFCPGGALPIPDGDRVVPVLNRWLAAAHEEGIPVLASRDWHPEAHPSFKSRGGPWPPHCLQDSVGAAFHPGLMLPAGTVKIAKGVRFDLDQYSAFKETGLAELLRAEGIGRLFVGGLAEDVCVRATVLDAREHGFEVHLIPGGSLPVTPEGGREAREAMRQAGAQVEEPSEAPVPEAPRP